MKSWLSSPSARAVLLVLTVVPACVVQKGGTDSDGGSTDGSGSSLGDTSGDTSATSGAVLTSTVGLTSTGETTGGSMDTSSGGTGSSGTTGEPAIMCGGENPFFPEFDRSCTVAIDCTFVFHQIDCCGSLIALGLNGEAGKPFQEAEAECVAQYPACRCAPMPTIADDGKTVDDPSLLEVACTDNECQTVVP